MVVQTAFVPALAFVLSFIGGPAHAQVVQIEAIPSGLPSQAVHDLESQRASLLRQRNALQSQINAFNQRCASVPEDSPLLGTCEADQTALEAAAAKYNGAVDRYNKLLSAYRCKAADASIATLRQEIKSNEHAIEKIGLTTTTETYERLEDMTTEQLRDFEGDMLEATLSAFVEIGKIGVTKAGSIGTAQGKHMLKRARELGIDNPHVLEAIEVLYKARGKPEMARAFTDVITQLKHGSFSFYNGYKAGSSTSRGEQAWRVAAAALVITEDTYPELADELAKRFPSLAYSAAKGLTVSAGAALAAPTVSFVYNMRALGYTRDAVAALDVATTKQLEAVNHAHERMKRLVEQLKTQKMAAAATCHS
jgi:hypothetical protein